MLYVFDEPTAGLHPAEAGLLLGVLGRLRDQGNTVLIVEHDEAAGDPEHGIAPGTRWEDVPPNWTCPECGARKEDFEMIEL